MAKKGKSITSTAVWILMGLLILGLGGFGATNLSGQIRSIGTVGDLSMPVETYGRMLQQEIRAAEQQTGGPITFQRAQELGLDQAVLQRFVQTRALDNETAQIGLSIGDTSLRDRILDIPAFKGVDGTFDRESYKFALERAGVSETQFETQLREEVSRTLLQGAIAGGVAMPAAYADTLVNYVGEKRDFTWTRLGQEDLAEPLPEPTDAELRAHHEANIQDFTLPETKELTYAALTPDMLIGEVEVSDAELREAYDQRVDEFNQPERRLVERLIYQDQESADAAVAALASGTSFEELVTARGLELSDIDLGDVGRLELDAAGEAVFATDVGAVAGPLPTSLGPALFRVNGILPAQSTSFEDALPMLKDEVANDRARRLVEAQAQNLEDLLAGGATLEDLARETDMELGQMAWTTDTSEGLAGYEAFREAAAALSDGDFPTIKQLEDGSLFALRLDNVLPPRPAPYEDVVESVLSHWTSAQIETRLSAQAEALLPQLKEGAPFAELGLDAVKEEGLTRSAPVTGTPADFMTQVFEMAVGDVRIIKGFGSVIVVRLDAIAGPGNGEQVQALRAQLTQQADQSLAQSLFNIFAADVTARARPQVNAQAVQAVHANFR